MNIKNSSELMDVIRANMTIDHISINDLAARMNKDPSSVSGSFHRPNVTLKTIREICDALNYDLDIEIKKRQ